MNKLQILVFIAFLESVHALMEIGFVNQALCVEWISELNPHIKLML